MSSRRNCRRSSSAACSCSIVTVFSISRSASDASGTGGRTDGPVRVDVVTGSDGHVRVGCRRELADLPAKASQPLHLRRFHLRQELGFGFGFRLGFWLLGGHREGTARAPDGPGRPG